MTHLKHLCAYTICGLFATSFTSAGVVTKIDFEVGPTVSFDPKASNWQGQLKQAGNSPRIVAAESGITPRSGKYMMKTYLNRETSSQIDRTEVDLLNQPREFEKGKEYWIGVSILLPKNWVMDYSGDSNGYALQLHGRPWTGPGGKGRKIQPLVFQHTVNGWVIKMVNKSTANESLGGNGNVKGFAKTVPYTLGNWTDFVINLKVSGASSADDTNGFIRVWVNGNKIVDHVGQNYYGDLAEGPYLKMGLYNSMWDYPERWGGPSNRTLYHDALIIGDSQSSFEEVSPKSGSSGIIVTTQPPSPPSNLKAE